jgi:alpha-L-rhamnosidase
MNRNNILFIYAMVIATLTTQLTLTPVHALTVEQMTTNGRTNPLNISIDHLTFGWATASRVRGTVQKAYRIRVGILAGANNIWDSQRVESDQQVGVVLPQYVKLAPTIRYYWQVKTWDASGVESPWSAAAWFETGLLSPADWMGAHWIARQEEVSSAAQWSDYVATVEFSVNDIALGVLLRSSSNGENAYMIQVNIDGTTPRLIFHKKVANQYIVMATVDLNRFGFTNGELKQGRHKLEFELRSSSITTRLDGKTVDARIDGTFKSGGVGIRTYGSERGTVYHVKVVQNGASKAILDTSFADGNPFSNGKIVNGAYEIAENTEAVYVGVHAPLPLLRGVFKVKNKVRSARVYAAARGLYELTMNGKKVGDQFLAPGWTNYNKRIQTQAYDVTDLMRHGANILGVALGDGWYKGKVGIGWKRAYGDTLALIAKVKITYADGSVEWFGTDGQWRASNSPRLIADLQDGESYDARLEQVGWNTAGFDASTWRPVRVMPDDYDNLVPQPDEPVRQLDILTAKTRATPTPGSNIYDLGQNMVGVARVRMTGKKGKVVTIRYAEDVYHTGDRQGQIYTDNLRSAKATDSYRFAQDGVVTYEPAFTQHGFRYVEISGTDTPPNPSDVKGVVRGSDLPNTGDLQSSNSMLNQLVRNIRWGQRGNFVSIPTDTPARDERLGWTGDISIFAPTASTFQDTRAFLSKWMDDVCDTQFLNGNIPAVVPNPTRDFDSTGVGWSDAFITVPYAVWKATGDDRIIRQHWIAIQKFYGFVQQSANASGDLIERGRSSWFSGDWLNLETNVDRLQEHQVIGTAYFAEDTKMMSEMAAAVGDAAMAQKLAALTPQICQAFTDAFVRNDGFIYQNSQTVYAMALGMNLILDPAERKKVANKFLEKLAADHYHLRTGFLGTPWLLPALSNIDRPDIAFRLLLNEDFPSWGFEVKMGATTMWERWNSLGATGEFGPVEMNSFNHYAFGAVADWMYQHIGGLQTVEPGYKKSRISPIIRQGDLMWAKASIRTTYGLLACSWKLTNGALTLDVIVPSNTSSEIVIPTTSAQAVLEGGHPAMSAAGVKMSSFKDGALTLLVGSGHYTFTVSHTDADLAALKKDTVLLNPLHLQL